MLAGGLLRVRAFTAVSCPFPGSGPPFWECHVWVCGEELSVPGAGSAGSVRWRSVETLSLCHPAAQPFPLPAPAIRPLAGGVLQHWFLFTAVQLLVLQPSRTQAEVSIKVKPCRNGCHCAFPNRKLLFCRVRRGHLYWHFWRTRISLLQQVPDLFSFFKPAIGAIPGFLACLGLSCLDSVVICWFTLHKDRRLYWQYRMNVPVDAQ